MAQANPLVDLVASLDAPGRDGSLVGFRSRRSILDDYLPVGHRWVGKRLDA